MSPHSTPLTQSQTLLWLGQELNPGSPMYNMGMSYELQGTLSVPVFIKAFELLVSQSDALRSIFEIEKGHPVQRYLSQIEYTVPFEDLSILANPMEAYKEWESTRIAIPFDLKKCLFDCVIIKLDHNKYIWYLNQHHLITDGWSTTILFSKMSQLYASILKEASPQLDALPLFKDYSIYCNQEATLGKIEKASNHWAGKLKNIPPPSPLYFKKDIKLNTASHRSLVLLGAERSLKLKTLANQKGIRGWTLDSTYYTLFLTAFFAFLYRVTGQNELVIGSPSHNRTSKAFKNTIGLFIESFPLHIHIETNDTFLTLFKKVQLESNSFLKNAQAGASSPDLSRSYNTFFNYINATNTEFNSIPVRTSWIHPEHTDPRHHIRLHVHDFDNTGNAQLYIDLNKEVFNKEERDLVPQHFLSMLDFCTDHPEKELSQASLITQKELQKIAQWNNTTVSYPENEQLLTKFSEQVLKTPDKTALIFDNKRLTYLELDIRSNQVAHFLIQKGINQNKIVALSMERSLEMMICLYGILKAGAAYTPLDTSLPEKRLSYILQDTKSSVLLYNHDGIDPLSHPATHCYSFAQLEKELSHQDTSLPRITIKEEDLAYVIYTSGSTGEPKGVLCLHKGICNRLNWMDADHPLSEDDVLLQKTPITFDVSLNELFWPLQKGATLVIEKPEGHKNPEGLRDTIKKYGVSFVHFVPSMLSIFIQTKSISECSSLKKIVCSGEALPATLVHKTYELLDVELYNLYGPTEASLEVTSWLCSRDKSTQDIPIGHPVANTKLYILDKNRQLLPIGVAGELYIGGVQVAQGYLNKKALTQEHFINNIFEQNPNETLYKTGDLARYRRDGAIQYLGRIDTQIKLRGQRIELGEIEFTIQKIKTITQAIVCVDAQDNLVAYYTGDPTDHFEITAFLENQLPKYMIPVASLHINQFDLASSGKIDRKGLLTKYPLEKERLIKKRIAPQTEIEELVHEVWKDVLQMKEIGMHENFIRIGGNSLMAIAITSRLKEALELEVAINDIFNYPTIRLYAAYVEEMITLLLNDN